jgi:3-phytase
LGGRPIGAPPEEAIKMAGRALSAVVVFILGLGLLPWAAAAQSGPLRLLGEFSFPSKTTFEGTTVGGLSGIAYDARRGVYYAVSDDRGELEAPRFYTLRIDIGPGGIRDVRIVGVTTLDSDASAPGIQPYERNDSDLEEIVLLPDGDLLISSERDRNGRPWIRRFALDGTLLDELPQREKFVPITQTDAEGRTVVLKGTRTNLGYEGLALSPDGGTLHAANEEALAQDGPVATRAEGTNVRIVEYGLGGPRAGIGPERVYRTEPIFADPNPPTQFADNGVSSLLWIGHVLPQFDLLAMERSFATGVGNDVSIYGVRLAEAQDVAGADALPSPFGGRTASKTLLVNVGRAGIVPDNLEGMTLGPPLPNGKLSLIAISDDNFSAFDPPQVNQFILFELDAIVGK